MVKLSQVLFCTFPKWPMHQFGMSTLSNFLFSVIVIFLPKCHGTAIIDVFHQRDHWSSRQSIKNNTSNYRLDLH